MSIQPVRVLWRIVDEVACAPLAPLSLEELAGASATGEQHVDVVRPAPGTDAGGFATLFHFWVHALRAFLDRSGQADQLEGAAGRAMCERLDAAALARELECYRCALVQPASLVLGGSALDAYRMIDGPCRRSVVIGTDAGPCAVFFSHGARVRPLRVA